MQMDGDGGKAYITDTDLNIYIYTGFLVWTKVLLNQQCGSKTACAILKPQSKVSQINYL